MDASISNHPSSTKKGGSRYKLTRAQLSSLEKPLRKGLPLTSAFGSCDGLDKRNFWWYNGYHMNKMATPRQAHPIECAAPLSTDRFHWYTPVSPAFLLDREQRIGLLNFDETGLVERRRKRAAAQVHKTHRKKLDEIEHKIASLQGTIHFLQNLQRKNDLPQPPEEQHGSKKPVQFLFAGLREPDMNPQLQRDRQKLVEAMQKRRDILRYEHRLHQTCQLHPQERDDSKTVATQCTVNLVTPRRSEQEEQWLAIDSIDSRRPLSARPEVRTSRLCTSAAGDADAHLQRPSSARNSETQKVVSAKVMTTQGTMRREGGGKEVDKPSLIANNTQSDPAQHQHLLQHEHEQVSMRFTGTEQAGAGGVHAQLQRTSPLKCTTSSIRPLKLCAKMEVTVDTEIQRPVSARPGSARNSETVTQGVVPAQVTTTLVAERREGGGKEADIVANNAKSDKVLQPQHHLHQQLCFTGTEQAGAGGGQVKVKLENATQPQRPSSARPSWVRPLKLCAKLEVDTPVQRPASARPASARPVVSLSARHSETQRAVPAKVMTALGAEPRRREGGGKEVDNHVATSTVSDQVPQPQHHLHQEISKCVTGKDPEQAGAKGKSVNATRCIQRPCSAPRVLESKSLYIKEALAVVELKKQVEKLSRRCKELEEHSEYLTRPSSARPFTSARNAGSSPTRILGAGTGNMSSVINTVTNKAPDTPRPKPRQPKAFIIAQGQGVGGGRRFYSQPPKAARSSLTKFVHVSKDGRIMVPPPTPPHVRERLIDALVKVLKTKAAESPPKPSPMPDYKTIPPPPTVSMVHSNVEFLDPSKVDNVSLQHHGKLPGRGRDARESS